MNQFKLMWRTKCWANCATTLRPPCDSTSAAPFVCLRSSLFMFAALPQPPVIPAGTRRERLPLGSSRQSIIGGGLRNLRHRVCAVRHTCVGRTPRRHSSPGLCCREQLFSRGVATAPLEKKIWRSRGENLSFSVFSVCLPSSVHKDTTHTNTAVRCVWPPPRIRPRRSREADRSTRPGETGHSAHVS